MPSARASLANSFVRAAGPSAARVVNLQTGWPSRIQIFVDGTWQNVDLYISTISSHARKSYELRFQNPAAQTERPIIKQADAKPILMGYTEAWGKPICVVPDVKRRLGSANRFSILFRDTLIQQAVSRGWAEYYSSTDETITAFHASLLPAYLAVESAGDDLPVYGITMAIDNTGFNEVQDLTITQRARVAITRLARDWAFRKDVISAYDGQCALCGLDWGLIQAAHIYPASAPGSPDAIPNGLGLCGNHHAMFDLHKLHIDPSSRKVRIHPNIVKKANEPGRLFLETTYDTLQLPLKAAHHPDPEMLAKRYTWFEELYKWAA